MWVSPVIFIMVKSVCVIRVEEVWYIGWYGIGKTLGLKNLDAVSIKESNNSEAGCLITLFYFRNTSPMCISNLLLYWSGYNIMDVVNSIQSVISLQWILTPSCLWIKWTISTYNKKQYIIQIRNWKTYKVWSDFGYENIWWYIVWDARLDFLSGVYIFDIFEIYGFKSKEKNSHVK